MSAARTKQVIIDFSAYKSGIYFIKMEIENKVYMHELLKSRGKKKEYK